MKKKILINVTTWMGFECVMFREIKKYDMILSMMDPLKKNKLIDAEKIGDY